MPNPKKGQLEKHMLGMHLRGSAKSWFKSLGSKVSYEECKRLLVARFKMTDQQKHMKKMAVFKTKQEPAETRFVSDSN